MILTKEQRLDLHSREYPNSIVRYFDGHGGRKRRAQYNALLDLADRVEAIPDVGNYSIEQCADELGVPYSRLYRALELATLADELGVDPRQRNYDAATAGLANLATGSRANALLGAANASRVHKLAATGRSAHDIVLITGLSRATVYRALRRLDSEAPSAPHERDPLLL